MKIKYKLAVYGTLLFFAVVTSFYFIPTKVGEIRVAVVVPKTNTQIIKEVFGKDGTRAIEIAKCESNLRAVARGDSGWSVGLFQIYTKVHTQYSAEQLTDPLYNTQVAYKIFQEKGWRPWSCAKRI